MERSLLGYCETQNGANITLSIANGRRALHTKAAFM